MRADFVAQIFINAQLVEGNSMTVRDEQYWFPAKKHFGWGWGLPTAWQGWVVLVVFFCLIVAGSVVLLPSYDPQVFVAYTVFLSLLLVAVCWAKGEHPRWHWGKE